MNTRHFTGILASSQLGLSCSTVHDVLCKSLELCACKLYLVQNMGTCKDHDSRKQFALEMPFHIEGEC
jgi:hypothetical protein